LKKQMSNPQWHPHQASTPFSPNAASFRVHALKHQPQ
jgi:hypothetical protein